MNNLKLLHRASVNFGLKREYAIPLLLTQSRLVIDLSVANISRQIRGNSNYFGSLQPFLFIPTLGFTAARSQSLKFDKNLVDIDISTATKYKLVIVPSTKLKAVTVITIYESLYDPSIEVIRLDNSNLFLGNL
ncbi:hypothetical protein PseudUWO311_00580 [Pseudanabaena sp. UWO311]|uniref:hypothetical protein n=1 Tax=Pseudanabaena sp. UWO311 TaxID=2487337 RepID=UPI00115A6728|nr:hypothetical protein [Pseudanabaena sp. UWO311]TYQ29426.1 hypothetical protein PseudUWO311_00580 [Pseudanabaena sp. UWO311]